MKIGIDARMYQDTGIGRYISNLIKELERIDNQNDYVIFVTNEGSELYHPNNPRFKKWIANYPIYSFSEQTSFLFDLYRANLDLLHVPHFNVPVFYTGKMVVTIHDLTMHDFKSSNATNQDPFMFSVKQFAYKFVTSSASRKAKKIFVPSSVVKEEVVSRLRFAKESKIVVTHEGVDDTLAKYKAKDMKAVKTRLEEMQINNSYVLYVGNAYPHKNLESLVIAYKELLESGKYRGFLVVAGKVDKFSERLAGFVHALKLDQHVIFAARYSEKTRVTDQDLSYLYMGATAYILPSLKEGFSITPLEAQSFDIPVLISDIPTHKEVFADSVLYFDPNSNIDLSEKMLSIINNESLRKRLTEAGHENVKKYSWANLAKKTLEQYLN